MDSIPRLNMSMTAFYSSLEEATETERSYAKANGYCLKIRSTQRIGNKPNGMIKTRILHCIHSGRPSSEANVRRTRTLRQDCPFLLRISKNDESGHSWATNIIIAEHNHEASDEIAVYPSVRTLTVTEDETVHNSSSTAAKPRIVIGALAQQNTNNSPTRQDICEIKNSKNSKMHESRPIQPAEVLLIRNVIQQIQQRHDKLLPHQQQLFLRSLIDVVSQDFGVWNPLIGQTRENLTGSTQRDASTFEYAVQTQQLLPQSQRRKSCGICNTTGHNARTCSQRDDPRSSDYHIDGTTSKDVCPSSQPSFKQLLLKE